MSHSQSFEVGHGYFRDLMRYFHHGFIILLPKLNAIVTIKKKIIVIDFIIVKFIQNWSHGFPFKEKGFST